MHARQHRTRPDRIHPHARTQRLRKGLGRRPKPRLRDRVRKEVRGELQHPLIDNIDDVPGLPLGQMQKQRLRQQHRRPQVRILMERPALRCHRCNRIVPELRGVIDETHRRPEPRGHLRDQPHDRAGIRQIRRKRDRPPPPRLDLGHQLQGFVLRPEVVHADVIPRVGQGQRDRPPDPPSRPRDERAWCRRRFRHDGSGPSTSVASGRTLYLNASSASNDQTQTTRLENPNKDESPIFFDPDRLPVRQPPSLISVNQTPCWIVHLPK